MPPNLISRDEPIRRGFPVAPLGCRADQIPAEPFAVVAHPADAARGYARHQGKFRHVLCHHRSGSDEGVTADGMTAHDRRVGADGGAALDQGRRNSLLRDITERGLMTLVNTQLGPQKTSSSSVTPS